MEIISVIPRGYCQGVVRAIQTARRTAQENPGVKVTMLGMIVHNRYVVEACRQLGIRFVEDKTKTRLELLDLVDEGIVIFTAHGVCDAVREKAEKKGLTVVDATCQDVIRTHTIVREHVKNGDVIYIGKKNHPEAEGTTGISNRIHLVTCPGDVRKYPGLENVLITNQTTLSIIEIQDIIRACLQMYPDAVISKEICNATRVRQEAVLALRDCDLLIVVGDSASNNSRQLALTGKQNGIPESVLIDSVLDLKEDMIRNKNRIAVTSGSSTPNELTSQVIDTLKHYADTGEFILPDSVSCRLL